jgi:hypothetical protein
LVVLLGLLALPACSREEPVSELVWGQKVRGKVTYNGKPVAYGYVLFYSPDNSVEHDNGTMTPIAQAQIQGGQYEMDNVPAGPFIVCVATNPDVDPGVLTGPTRPGGFALEGDPGAAPEGPEPPPLGPDGKPLPRPEEEPVLGPDGQPLHAVIPNLSAEQKATLRTIHSKYGQFDTSPLVYTVTEGEQTYDILLK